MIKTVSTVVFTFLVSGTAVAENVEVYVADLLDNIQNGYCLDIAKGKGSGANPEDGMLCIFQSHPFPAFAYRE